MTCGSEEDSEDLSKRASTIIDDIK